MGLRCSLLGHDYGEPFVERGREERGNEVVVTERELQECTRCGAENVTTENTEVRSIEPTDASSRASADAGASTDAGTTASATGGSSAAGSASGSSPGDSDTTAGSSGSASSDDSSGGAFTSASDAIERAEADVADDARATADDTAAAGDAGDDDAVIIDDSADGATGSEQWDEQEDVDAEHEPTPEPDDEDVEFVDSSPASGPDSADTAATSAASANSGSNDAETGAQQSSGAQAVTTGRSSDRPRGEWPEPDGEDAGVDATDDSTSFQFGDENEQFVEADTGFTSAGPLEQSGSDDDLDFALYCPECGFERPASGSSLRAGDICPDCRKGYLAEDR